MECYWYLSCNIYDLVNKNFQMLIFQEDIMGRKSKFQDRLKNPNTFLQQKLILKELDLSRFAKRNESFNPLGFVG